MVAQPFKRLLFVTEPDGSFGVGVQTWLTLDLERIRRIVGEGGFATDAVRIDKLLDFAIRDGDIVFYTSAYSAELRAFFQEVLYFARERVPIAPAYELLLAHENKGVQELLKSALGFGNLPGIYHVDFDERSMSPPYVFKTVTGAGSRGVRLVRTAADEERIKRRYFGAGVVRRLKLLQRGRVLKSPGHVRRYAYYYKRFMPFVLQPFVEGLTGDIKILVFGERYYTLHRSNRPNDFRASGSGLIDYDTPCPPHVLDFAREVTAKLDTPFISLDIAEADGRCHLIEFQALNVGPTTVTGSNGYYVEKGDGWERVSASPDLEEAYAHAMIHYLDPRHRP